MPLRVSVLLVAGTHIFRQFTSANRPILYHLPREEQRMAQMGATNITAIEPLLG